MHACPYLTVTILIALRPCRAIVLPLAASTGANWDLTLQQDRQKPYWRRDWAISYPPVCEKDGRWQQAQNSATAKECFKLGIGAILLYLVLGAEPCGAVHIDILFANPTAVRSQRQLQHSGDTTGRRFECQ